MVNIEYIYSHISLDRLSYIFGKFNNEIIMKEIKFKEWWTHTDNDTVLIATPNDHIESNTITFKTWELEVLKFYPNWDIFVQGRLAENDIEVVQGFREWLKKMNI